MMIPFNCDYMLRFVYFFCRIPALHCARDELCSIDKLDWIGGEADRGREKRHYN